jgi:hypothetical protein
MPELTEVQQDFAYAEGFLESWLKGEPKTPPQVLEHLKILADGVKHYRDLLGRVQEDYRELERKYNALTAQSAQYLQFISQQKELLDQTLIDQQREFHEEPR